MTQLTQKTTMAMMQSLAGAFTMLDDAPRLSQSPAPAVTRRTMSPEASEKKAPSLRQELPLSKLVHLYTLTTLQTSANRSHNYHWSRRLAGNLRCPQRPDLPLLPLLLQCLQQQLHRKRHQNDNPPRCRPR
jgi:hypothetical protein